MGYLVTYCHLTENICNIYFFIIAYVYIYVYRYVFITILRSFAVLTDQMSL